jgi:hypothetical protein
MQSFLSRFTEDGKWIQRMPARRKWMTHFYGEERPSSDFNLSQLKQIIEELRQAKS